MGPPAPSTRPPWRLSGRRTERSTLAPARWAVALAPRSRDAATGGGDLVDRASRHWISVVDLPPRHPLGARTLVRGPRTACYRPPGDVL